MPTASTTASGAAARSASGAGSCAAAASRSRSSRPRERARRLTYLECVVNVSEGRDAGILSVLGASCAGALLDLHADPDHHRAVFTLGGAPDEAAGAARALAATAVPLLDLRTHEGAHPRLGTVDVVPFVPLGKGGAPGPGEHEAAGARDAFAAWAAGELGVPCFLYGPLPGGAVRTLPEVRRRAFRDLGPDFGPARPDPRAGAAAVGARPVLVAWNMWIGGGDVDLARAVAATLRSHAVRALAFDLASGLQVSCNLVAPVEVGPADVFDQASRMLERARAGVTRCELVGLLPAAVLEATPRHRWDELAISPTRTIEAKLGAA